MSKKILGTSRVSYGRKISLLKTIAEKLKCDVGDEIVYYEENGKVFIDKA